MRISNWVAVFGLCAAFLVGCGMGETAPGGDEPSADAPAKGGKTGKRGKAGRGGKPGAAPDGPLTCGQVVKVWAPLYESEFPDQAKVDRPRLTTACSELGDIDSNQDKAKCWLTAKSVMDCDWGPNWLDDGIVYDGWS